MGYPDWYEGSRDNTRAKKPARLATNVQSNSVLDTPLEEVGNMPIGQHHTDANADILHALAQEMIKLMKGKLPAD